MKKQVKRTLLFYIVMAVAMSLPTSLFAQRESYGGIFGTNADAKEAQNKSLMGNQSRGNYSISEGGVIGNQGFNQTPLGGGVLMLIAAGAGYAVIKSKKSKK